MCQSHALRPVPREGPPALGLSSPGGHADCHQQPKPCLHTRAYDKAPPVSRLPEPRLQTTIQTQTLPEREQPRDTEGDTWKQDTEDEGPRCPLRAVPVPSPSCPDPTGPAPGGPYALTPPAQIPRNISA